MPRLLRTVAILVVLGVLAYDGGAILVNRFQLDELGGAAAREALLAYEAQRSARAAEQAAAERIALEAGVEMEEFAVDDGVVHLTVSRRARLLVLDRVVADWGQGRVEKTLSRRGGPTGSGRQPQGFAYTRQRGTGDADTRR